jgi:23S rRNA (guanine745-N1)-methyltransferase
VDLDRLASWLRCPSCGADLQAVPPLVLRCARGHAVDANKRGYASLLAAGTRVTGDTGDMLAARGRFLDRGHYAPLMDALVAAVVGTASTSPADAVAASSPDPDVGDGAGRPGSDAAGGASAPARADLALRILDAGCGTGHYLHALLDRLPRATGLAADLSPAAVAIAVRGRADVDGVVADTWAALPLRDGVADLVLDVFAPRNLPEFHRVLAPGGRVAVVAAGPRHLEELRASGRAVGVQEDKRERILGAADALFEAVAETRVHRVLHLAEDDVALLLGMGPSAHHPGATRSGSPDAGPQDAGARAADAQRGAVAPAAATGDGLQDVTVDVMIHVLRRRDAVASASV